MIQNLYKEDYQKIHKYSNIAKPEMFTQSYKFDTKNYEG